MKKKILRVKLIKTNKSIKITNKQKKAVVQMTTATVSRKNGHKKKVNIKILKSNSQLSINNNRTVYMKIRD